MSGNVDQDAVLQARNVLLSSARPTRRQEAEAYRVLAKVSPASYAPKLANALIHLSFDDSVRELPQAGSTSVRKRSMPHGNSTCRTHAMRRCCWTR